MIEIVLLALLLLLLAKKKGSGRSRMSGYRNLSVVMDQSIGALTADTQSGFNIPGTATERMWASSVQATYTMTDLTAGEGPVHLYVAHSDYEDSEVQEWRQATGAWDQGDLVAREQRSRKCRYIGTFSGLTESETLNDGKPIKTKLGWMIETGDTLQFSLFATEAHATGAELVINGKLNAFVR